MKEIRIIAAVFPLRGWMLDLAVVLDTAHPGFAGAYLRASSERRQVIAAYCAKVCFGENDYSAVAGFLASSGHKAILHEAFGDVPRGMRGVLARVGSQPQDRRFYTSLHRFLSEPAHPSLAAAIRRMPELDFPRLRILNLLPPDICTPSVAELVGDLGTAKDVVRLFEMLVANGVNRAAVAEGLRALTRPEQMGKFWDRWISDCPLPASPLSMMPNCRPTTTVGELFSLARRYRNCAARHAPEALENTSAFGELLIGEDHPGMVVHLRQKRGEWAVEGLFLKQNMRPDADAREAAYQLLERAGIARPPRATASDGPWSSLRRLTSRPFWDFND